MRFIHLSGLRLGEGAFDERFQIDYRAEREQAFRSVLDAAREGEPEGLKADSDHIPGMEYSADDFDLDREYEEWKAAEEGDDLDHKPEKKGFGKMLESLFGKNEE